MRFRSYGALVVDRWPNRLDLRLPFFHLSNQGIWEPLTAEMQWASSPDNCAVCEMEPRFYDLLAGRYQFSAQSPDAADREVI